MIKPFHVLAFRFSALGDVAMTVPVIRLVLQQNPGLHITFVSTSFVQPFFEDIERLYFYAADFKGKHKGVKGLYQLHNELKLQASFDAIADLHNVLRTKILRFFFSLPDKKTAVINKGRKEKRELTRIKNKLLRPLPSTFERYADVFASLGLSIKLHTEESRKNVAPLQQLQQFTQQGLQLIGLAPFARHAEKMYPLEKMKQVVQLLNAEGGSKIFLFGAKGEAELLQQWEDEFDNVQSLAGKMSFSEELKWMVHLDLMISMDSANMHLASLFAVPVISVWGATHPYVGFYGWGQKAEHAVQVDLYCRPCSVFGNRPCYRKDLACMHSINPVTIYDRVTQQLYRLKNPS